MSGTSSIGKKCRGENNLKRLDSLHLNALTSKAFNKKERPQSSPTKFKKKASDEALESETSPIRSQNSSPSPLRKGKKLDLDAISEKDSFVTDSSFVASETFISAQRQREQVRKERADHNPYENMTFKLHKTDD